MSLLRLLACLLAWPRSGIDFRLLSAGSVCGSRLRIQYVIVIMPLSCSVRVSSSKAGPVQLEKPGSHAPSDLCAYSFAMTPSRTLMMHCTTLGSCFFFLLFCFRSQCAFTHSVPPLPGLPFSVLFLHMVPCLFPGITNAASSWELLLRVLPPHQRISYS